jgi:hypothetical protein
MSALEQAGAHTINADFGGNFMLSLFRDTQNAILLSPNHYLVPLALENEGFLKDTPRV